MLEIIEQPGGLVVLAVMAVVTVLLAPGESLSAYVIVGTNVLLALVVVLVYGTETFTRRSVSNLEASIDD